MAEMSDDSATTVAMLPPCFMVCIGCWKPLPDTHGDEAIGPGMPIKCCGRTYESDFTVREGQMKFRQGYRLSEDADGPVPDDGGARIVESMTVAEFDKKHGKG